ncbi:competence type IV pilus minor pilin ComGD [Rossellomorea sp. AcN35-11]|nr:type II secretion system GspH family protein [Rossellomorea aquimaris]WJV28057.1 competence type IV pilus minor pilin ComGD [Rossellomorea sp. AcN35-11]
MKASKAEAGYTLMEMLVVILIFMTLLSWASFSILPMKEQNDQDLFLSQLQSDLYHIQSHSISHETPVTLTFYPSSNKYVARTITRQTVLIRELSPLIKISTNSLIDITFFPNGNTNRFGKVNFKMGDTILQLMFQIGQGRFYVQEY